MDVKLVGSFVFINQGYNILSSLYHNNIATEPYPETAKRKIGSPISTDLFEGLYTTIWLEPLESEDKTDLEIIRLADRSYSLKWYLGNNIYYYGIGFLRNNELVGSYWQLQ